MQNNFDNTEPHIPFDKVWSNMKPALDKEAAAREKRKKRVVIFWWLVAVIVAGGLFWSNSESGIQNQELGVRENELKMEKRNLELGIGAKELATKNNEQETNTKQKTEITNNKEHQTSNTKQILAIENKEFASNNGNQQTSNSKQLYQLNKQKKAIDIFENIPSYADINLFKLQQNLSQKTTADNATSSSLNIEPSIEYNKTVNDTPSRKKPEILNASATTAASKTTKNHKQKTVHYGLQWNLPLQNRFVFTDANANNKSVVLLIPQFWVSKQLAQKHSVVVAFNPFSQYFFGNKAIVNYNEYAATIHQGSQIDNKPETIQFTETVSFNKLISAEASLLYQYQLSSKIKVGAGVGCNWLQGALLKNKVIKNNTIVTRDSLFGINKDDAEWNYINNSFFMGKIEAAYQFKKISLGLQLSKPINNVFKNANHQVLPINTCLWLRYHFK